MKKIITIFLLGALGVAAHAQQEPLQADKLQEKYPLEWFVGAGGGFNYSFDAGRFSGTPVGGFSGKGMGTSIDIYAGKWLNRSFGLRVGYHGINTSADEKYEHDYGSHPFFYVHGDVTFRPFTWLVPYVHAGYANVNHRTYGIRKGSLGGGAGVTFPIRAGRISFIPGLRITLFNADILDYADVNTKTLRYKFSATLGIAYHWTGKKHRPRVEYVDREVFVPVEVPRVDTVLVHRVDTVYIREKAEELNSRMFADVLFDVNSSHLRTEAYPILQEAVTFLKENPGLSATIEGHADITGNDNINQPLSERRAQAVMYYLIGHGIDPQRLRAVGYSSWRPKADNTSAEGRQQNRRMEFVFTYE